MTLKRDLLTPRNSKTKTKTKQKTKETHTHTKAKKTNKHSYLLGVIQQSLNHNKHAMDWIVIGLL
jgi:hypothetical protein